MSLWDEFAWRGLIHTATEGLEDVLTKERLTIYNGFDPTAASLHIGSLLPIMMLARLQRAGHRPIAIIGGGTGLIGDPSGKTLERQLLTKDQIAFNLTGIREQLTRFLDFDARENPAQIIDNADWLTTINLTDFLRDIGKHFTVNAMLAKESVKRRIEQEDGISFTEFSYSLLQAYDYLELFDRQSCTLQTGGSDQWGNITAGIDLIRRTRGARAHGLVFPLVVNAAGTKFGKTESGAVWLDPQLTSPYQFYQFWLNVDDRDVVMYLNYFTWLTREAIADLAERLVAAPEKREAQRTLAREVTRMTHGDDALQRAERSAQFFFGTDLAGASGQDILDVFGDSPSTTLGRDRLGDAGISVVELLVASGVASSKAEARRLTESGGIYVNNRRASGAQQLISLSDSIDGQFIVLRKGQKNYHLVRLA